jgi:hypothetical protein
VSNNLQSSEHLLECSEISLFDWWFHWHEQKVLYLQCFYHIMQWTASCYPADVHWCLCWIRNSKNIQSCLFIFRDNFSSVLETVVYRWVQCGQWRWHVHCKTPWIYFISRAKSFYVLKTSVRDWADDRTSVKKPVIDDKLIHSWCVALGNKSFHNIKQRDMDKHPN